MKTNTTSNKNHRHQLRNRVLVGLAVAATMAVSAPAVEAQAITLSDYPLTSASTQSDKKVMQITLHLVDMQGNKIHEDMTVPVTYSHFDGTDKLYKFTKPVLEGYTSSGYYPDGAEVPFATDDPYAHNIATVQYSSTKLRWWSLENGVWYYRTSVPSVPYCKGWGNVDGKWYFLDRTTGAMKTGWVQDKGTWYYLWSDGSMASDTTVDGYYLDSTGACQ